MNESLPYAQTRAARLLKSAIARYTSANTGGLRGLAATLQIQQATVLSHMSNGRMAIPLDRAAQLAEVLRIDPPEFCLAVLEQRAPDVHKVLIDELGVASLAALPPKRRMQVHMIADALQLPEHAEVLAEVVSERRPRHRWLTRTEIPIIDVLRDRYPDGVEADEARLLANGLAGLME